MDIGWILEDKIRVTKQGGTYLVESLSTPYRANVTISTSPLGRMLFNGQDIETEDFMFYLQTLEEADASPDNPVIFEAEDS